MKKIYFLILVIVVFFGLKLQMANAEINHLCHAASIESITYKEKSRDTCSMPISELSHTEYKNLTALHDIHTKTANLLDIPVNQLFSRPIRIAFFESNLDALFSSASTFQIKMGVFPNNNNEFSKGVYAHELGHIISEDEDNENLPKSLQMLSRSNLFAETFSDLISISLFGKVFTQTTSDQSCMNAARNLDSDLSYNTFADFFKTDFSITPIIKCCLDQKKSSGSIHSKMFCKEVGTSGINLDYETRFSPQKIDLSDLDSHQIGLPIVSFLKKVNREGLINLNSFFEIGLKYSKRNSDVFKCEAVKGSRIVTHEDFAVFSLRSSLLNLRDSLSESDAKKFTSHFNKFALEKGLSLGDRYSLLNVVDDFEYFLRDNRKEECFSYSKEEDRDVLVCRMKCQKI